MKKFVYIYANADSLKDFLGINNEELSIEPFQCETTWERQMLFFSKHHDIDGLILDSELDVYNSERMFSGSAIAQEIRLLQKNRILSSFPIIFFTKYNVESSEKTFLFDIIINLDNIKCYAVKLCALANAYKIIGTEIINYDKKLFRVDFLEKINKQFADYLKKIMSNPTYIIAQFILNEFICKQGILIDEEVLAARLGIDKDASSDWNLVLDELDFAKYKGVFNEGWPRWWMFEIDKLWNEELKEEDYLISTPAAERVKAIKEKLGINNIIPATPLPKAESVLFWTVCKGYHKPLAPVDGLAIQGQENLFSWQETEYVSIEAALNRSNKKEWKTIADIEQYHFEKIEKYYAEKK